MLDCLNGVTWVGDGSGLSQRFDGEFSNSLMCPNLEDMKAAVLKANDRSSDPGLRQLKFKLKENFREA
jgi:hypothetical protein